MDTVRELVDEAADLIEGAVHKLDEAGHEATDPELRDRVFRCRETLAELLEHAEGDGGVIPVLRQR